MKTLRFIALMAIIMVIFKSEKPLQNVREMQGGATSATTSIVDYDVDPLYEDGYVTVWGPMYVLPNTLTTYTIERHYGFEAEPVLQKLDISTNAYFVRIQDTMSLYTFFSDKIGGFYVRFEENNHFYCSFPIICVAVLPY